jgi:hypothetical protein
MSTPKFKIEVSRPRTEGKTIAFVKVLVGPLWVTCRLDQSNGRFFLNPPSNFVESLQGRPIANGRTHSGWIKTAGFDPDFSDEVKRMAMTELGITEEAA